MTAWLESFAEPPGSPGSSRSEVIPRREIDHFPFILEERILEDVPDAISGILTLRGSWTFDATGTTLTRPTDDAVMNKVRRLSTLLVDQTCVRPDRPVFSLPLPRAGRLGIRSWPSWTPHFYHPSRLEARRMLRLEATFLR
jgi:hypothetical protein